MSGIFGIINLNHAPVDSIELSLMANALRRRGPDNQSFWQEGEVGLGHSLLATTESALFEDMPFRDATTGCVITADARIDNRDELIAALGMNDESKFVGDGELILNTYLKWGRACPEHLLGDFAFALWDPRNRELFCARDHFGMRPFIFHHVADKVFAFASSVPALLTQERIPKKINEARIADFLQNSLEDIDTVSTFYENVCRLSPAHSLCVSGGKLEVKRYWSLHPSGSMLNLSSDADYVEAFLEVFTASVKSRLMSADSQTLGSMLSGGMDSGSVVAMASRMLSDQGLPSLKTFSAVGPDPATCIETRSIHAAIGIGKVDPQMVNYAQLSSYIDEMRVLSTQIEEPFDRHMSLIRAIYLAAHRKGVKVMLDGVAGDSVLTEGRQMVQMIRSGHWLQAFNDAVGFKNFYGHDYSASRVLINAAKSAFIPNWARILKRSLSGSNQATPINAIINPAFARRVDLSGRLEQIRLHTPKPGLSDAEERAQLISRPILVVARERYDRVASVNGIEPRDPFLDRRLVDFCLRLPNRKLQAGGWSKRILRLAMSGRLPDDVIWRRGKEHLGLEFTSKVFSGFVGNLGFNEDDLERLSPYLSPELIVAIRRGELQGRVSHDILSLAFWLRSVH